MITDKINIEPQQNTALEELKETYAANIRERQAIEDRYRQRKQQHNEAFDAIFSKIWAIENNAQRTTNPFAVTKEVTAEAIRSAGFDIKSEIATAFYLHEADYYKFAELDAKGLEMGFEIAVLSMPEEEQQQAGWQFVPIRIFAPKDIMENVINPMLETDAQNGTRLFSNKTEIAPFDEGLDEYFDCEAYGIKCSLQPYVREIESYGITKSLFSDNGLSFNYALPVLKSIVDFIKENSTEPNKVRNYTANQIKLFDAIPICGLFYQILILYGLCYWCENVSHKIGEGKDGYNDVEEFWLWIKKLLISKLVNFTHMPFSDGDKEVLKPLCDYLYSTELGRTVQEVIFKDDEPRQQELELPQELSTEKALQWLNKAVACGLLDESYQPTAEVNSNGKKAALAVLLNELIELITVKGNSYKEYYSWKPFESLWGIDKLSVYAYPITNPNKDKPQYYEDYKTLLNK